MSAITLSRAGSNYRKVAQKWYGLTDEQMKSVDIHHSPPRHQGGRNIPEHLYVVSPSLHSAIHGNDYTAWARKGAAAGWKARQEKGMGKGYRVGGGPPKKTEPTQRDLEILRLRNLGHSRAEIGSLLGLSEAQVKRGVRECKKFGWEYTGKSGPKKGSPARGGVPKGTNQPNQYTK